ncbi:thermonuclease family protein [Turicibacter sanguinis]|uniref:thermonuclease family protein n=1 Tax=Turicibacter sanguinis TaxID=154288 RepID=UPI0018A9E797|nr:thermonuclease family protein [Turicibacter sanguinis]
MGNFKTGESTLKKFLIAFQTMSQSNLIDLESVTLKRVVDGDTIIVLDQNQNEVRVRLIGVDTPKSVHPDETKNTTDGDVASAYTKSQLKKGQTLYLEYDKERFDPYGRTLAYVWLEANVDPSDLNDIQSNMYNAKLIVEGCAVAKRFPP